MKIEPVTEIKVRRNNRCKGGIQILSTCTFEYFLFYGHPGDKAVFKDEDGNVLKVFTISKISGDTPWQSKCHMCSIGKKFAKTRYCDKMHCWRGRYLTDIDDVLESL
jgi:hypothetical protein